MEGQSVSATQRDFSNMPLFVTSNLSTTTEGALFSNLSQGYDGGVEDDDQLRVVSKTVSVTVLSLLIVLTFHGNVWVVLAILGRPHLRAAMANMFTVSLCSVDLLAAGVVMPLSLVSLAGGRDALGYKACQASGYTSTLAMLISTMTLSVIACERLYSIALPMHQAGHATPALYLLLVALLWLLPALLAAMPWLGLNSYSYSPSKRMCSLNWHSDHPRDETLAIIILLIAFIIPTLVLIGVYTRVFRVAKRAACGVAPQQVSTIASFPHHNTHAFVRQSSLSTTTDHHLPRLQRTQGLFPVKPSIQIQGASPSRSADLIAGGLPNRRTPSPWENEDSGIRSDSHLSISPNHKCKPRPTAFHRRVSLVEIKVPCSCRPGLSHKVAPQGQDHRNKLQTQMEPQQTSPPNGKMTSPVGPSLNSTSHGPSGAGYKVRPSHVKAFKTLLVIVLTHLLLWCPFFVSQLHELAKHSTLAFPLDAAVTWLSFLSYAVNPCLYGCLNRGVREELVRHLGHAHFLCCCYLRSKTEQGKTSVRCGCRVPCRPRSSANSSDAHDDEDEEDGEGGAESFFQFLQRTQADGE